MARAGLQEGHWHCEHLFGSQPGVHLGEPDHRAGENPAPASSTTDTAICATTIARCRRCLRSPPLNRRRARGIARGEVPSLGSAATNDSSSASATASAEREAKHHAVQPDLARRAASSARPSEMSNPTPPMAIVDTEDRAHERQHEILGQQQPPQPRARRHQARRARRVRAPGARRA